MGPVRMGEAGMPMLPMLIVLALAVVGVIALVLLLRRPVRGDPSEVLRRRMSRRLFPDGESSRDAGEEKDAFLVIPDISGYTDFLSLNRFALAHAQYAISELLKSMIAAAEGALEAAKIEGDAVLLCGWHGEEKGSGRVTGALVSAIAVDILRAFYRRQRELREANVCTCGACRDIGQLDIKMVVHRGPVLAYRLDGVEELSGLPVIVAHRLLKSDLRQRHYVMVTEEAHRDVRPALGTPATRRLETQPGVGKIAVYVYHFARDRLSGRDDDGNPPGIGDKTADSWRKLKNSLGTLKE